MSKALTVLLALLVVVPAPALAGVEGKTWGRVKELYRGAGTVSKIDSEAPKGVPNPELASSSRFDPSQCTWYAASEFDKVAPWPGCNWGGNAGSWTGNASAAGWKTFTYPLAAAYLGLPPGTIVVWAGGGYGHVAVVRSVFQNGIYIQEKNWPLGSGVSPWRLLFWRDVYQRGSYTFSGYIAPWRR